MGFSGSPAGLGGPAALEGDGGRVEAREWRGMAHWVMWRARIDPGRGDGGAKWLAGAGEAQKWRRGGGRRLADDWGARILRRREEKAKMACGGV